MYRSVPVAFIKEQWIWGFTRPLGSLFVKAAGYFTDSHVTDTSLDSVG